MRSTHDDPSRQNRNTGPSWSYTNWGQHAVGQGTINNINYYSHGSSNPLGELEKHCSPRAAFDSAARFDPPRCAEATRLRIIQIIEDWLNNDGDDAVPSRFFWLYGGAGVGKSALAQSLSEKLQGKQLASSFFFFRSDPTRNNGKLLIPTIVSHLIRTLKGLGIVPFVEDRIRENPALFTKRLQTQMQELLVEPLLTLKATGAAFFQPLLIIIDGLDECENTDMHRPEAHIARVFNHSPDFRAITVHPYNLSDDPDADMDIRRFLENEFMEIRQVHCIGQHLRNSWPSESAVASVVERSSGHFIYASTVIRYIQSPKHRPDNRLEVILRLRLSREGDNPFAQLDGLYTLIFSEVENYAHLEKLCLILGILYLQSLLEMKAGDLSLLLDPIFSLVAIDGPNVRILHKSLFDYLLDSTRSGHLPFNLARVHEVAATYILKQRIAAGVYTGYNFENLAYHCQYASLNDTLKNYFPYAASPKLIVEALVPTYGMNTTLQSIIWFFFRALSREDLDPTRQVFKEHAAKWVAYFDSSRVSRWQSKPEVFTPYELADLKLQLDTLLTQWNPQTSNPMGVGKGPAERIGRIKQLHSIISASTKSTNTVLSSLVLGEYVIHSYHFMVEDERSFLILQTYSTHGNASYGHMYQVANIRILVVHQAQNYLRTVEKYLFSDRCQNYGFKPDEDKCIEYYFAPLPFVKAEYHP